MSVLARDGDLDLDALRKSLTEVAPDAVLDDHGTWLQRFIGLAENVQLIAAGIVTLVGFATIAIVIFATRAGMAIHHSTIEILHLIGAKDSFIASQFQRHFFWLGLKGGLIGMGIARPLAARPVAAFLRHGGRLHSQDGVVR